MDMFSCAHLFKTSSLSPQIVNHISTLKMATDDGSLPEIAQYSPYYLPLNVLLLPKDHFIQKQIQCYFFNKE